jgi:hypothetical protein
MNYADEGTIAHQLAAMCLKQGTDAAAYIGRVLEGEDYEHAKLSPSGAHRWMLCPGSFVLEKRAAFTPRRYSMAVTEDMAAGVQVYLDNVRDYAAGGPITVEQPVPIGHLTGEEGATGTADAITFLDDEVMVHDLKFGRGVFVEAEENEQLMMYALGVLEVIDHEAINNVRLVIHQPRQDKRPREWAIDKASLFDFANEGMIAADEVRNAVADAGHVGWETYYLDPGNHCKFCEAKATCPALAQMVMDTVGAEFEELTKVPEVKHEDGPTISSKLAAVSVIEDWCKAVRAEVERRLFEGTAVPGYKLVQGKRGSRQWRGAEEVESLFKNTFRLKVEEMYDFSLISPTTAEKRAAAGIIGPKQWAKVQDLITQSEGKPSVAPELDKRPALVMKPAEEGFTEAFDDLL